jgi:Mlc titration factor MtfA (ptsG expression regulator)
MAAMWNPLRSWRRKNILKGPLPPSWQDLVDAHFSWVKELDPAEKDRFWSHLRLFAGEKNFEGIGMDITDEVRVIIAGQAARLSRNVGYHIYDKLYSILVYADDFKVPAGGAGPSGHDVHADERAVRGVAHPFGSVALSWSAATEGLSRPFDGHDTTLHEFAHIIDFEDGAFDGTPLLHRQGDYEAWILAASRHFEKLRKRPRKSVLDAYGATNEAEFFAVATETFFERPQRLKQKAPDLYQALATFYRVDP